MELTLRKANALVLEINKAISEITPSAAITIDPYDTDFLSQMESGAVKFSVAMTAKVSLIDVYYSVRDLIAEENSRCGVQSSVTELASIEQKIKLYSQYKTAQANKAIKTIENEINERAQLPADQKSYAPRITTSVLTLDDVEVLQSELKKFQRQKQSIKDKLLELNIKNSIRLSDAQVKILKDNGII